MPHRDHRQRCLVRQQHHTVEHRIGHPHARGRAAEELHLQPDRTARDLARLQSALSRIPVQPGRPQRRPTRTRGRHAFRARRRRSFEGLNFFDSHDQALRHAVQRPEFNLRELVMRSRPPSARHVGQQTVATVAPFAGTRPSQARSKYLPLPPHSRWPIDHRSIQTHQPIRHHSGHGQCSIQSPSSSATLLNFVLIRD